MYGYDTLSQWIRDPNLRASDAERDATADRLRRHHTDGRLDPEEFQERLDRCFAAKTVGELADLTRDLPGDGPERGARVGVGAGLLGGLRMIPIGPVALALTILLIVGVARGPWVLIPLFFLARGPVGRGLWGCGRRRRTLL